MLGITEILLITNLGSSIIENHFARSFELENFLKEKNDIETFEKIKNRYSNVNIYIKKASSNLSLAESVYDAKGFVDGEPFLLVLGDEILGNNDSCSKTLVEKYNELKSPILAVKKIGRSDIKNYGIVEGKQYKDNLMIIEKLIEKPSKNETNSNLAIIGRYVLNASIFSEIEMLQTPDFTKAMHNLKELKFALSIDGERFDCGSKLGLVKANISMALKNPEISQELKNYLKELLEQ